MRRLILLVGLSMAAAGGCGAPSSPPSAPDQPARRLSLRPGIVAEAGLAGGQSEAWRLDLPQEWFAEVVVEQQGIDALVRLEDPAGRRITAIDSPNGPYGPEPLVLLGQTQPFHLIVEAPNPQAAPGRYGIRVAALRRATQEDRARVAAERTFARGEELRRRGDGDALREAVTEHLRAREAFRALADRRREGDALDRLGRIHLARGDAVAAREAYRQAVPLFRQLDARQPLGDALNGLGKAFRALGRPADALACYHEALEIQTFLGHRRASGITWNNIGRLQAAQGETGEAFRAYEQALAVWRELKERGEEGVTLANIGRLYADLGETGRAQNTLEEAATLLEAEGRVAEAAAALADLSLIQGASGHPREALATLDRALRLQRRAGDRSGEAVTLNQIGWIHLEQGATGEAQASFQSALALHEKLGQRPHQARVLANLGQVEARRGRPRAALDLYNRALPLLAEAGDRQSEASVLYNRARVWRQLGDLAAARRDAEEALARIETLRGKPGSGELRASFLASWQEIYELLVDTLLELHRREPDAGYAGEALMASERARARSLLDVLPEEAPGSGPDPALVTEEAEMGRRLALAEQNRRRLAATGAPAAQLAKARSEVDELLRARERLEAEIEPAEQDAEPERILTFQEIQREVAAPGTLLLEYSLGEARSFLWAVAPDRLDVFELAPRARLEAVARRAYEQLSAQGSTSVKPSAEATLAELSRLLLAPVADRLAGQRLLIVPDGALAYVPFAALPAPDSGEPLIEAHEIVALPSASTLSALRRRSRGPAPSGLVAIVAPILDLPFSREEAAAIQRLAPANRRFEALGPAASRQTVLSGILAGYRIVHFATHGVIDSEHPTLSGLALSPVDAEGRRQEPFLRACEIRRLRLPAELVVLSACETALGKEVRGEGLMGLTQSFFQAGARRVVVSLWSVDDRATAELMERFYDHLLAEGQSPAAALRAAQISLRRKAPFQSPASWAGFVLQGDF